MKIETEVAGIHKKNGAQNKCIITYSGKILQPDFVMDVSGFIR